VNSFPACTDAVEHAVVSKNSKILALNSFVSPGTDLTLNDALLINDRGEVSGFGTLSNGDQHDFLLLPCDDNHNGGGSLRGWCSANERKFFLLLCAAAIRAHGAECARDQSLAARH
jgi:hypothetical protein